jgi:hypothetical protein
MNKYSLSVVIMAFLLMGVACNASSSVEEIPIRDKLITFIATIKADADGQIGLDLGVSNAGNLVPADESFVGEWELSAAGDEPRAKGTVVGLPEMAAGEYMLVSWAGKLDPGTYRLLWGAPDYGHTVVDFEVLAGEGGQVRVGDQTVFFTTDDPPR